MTIHDRLPIVVETVHIYTVGCSCGWVWESHIEEWAERELQRHHDLHKDEPKEAS